MALDLKDLLYEGKSKKIFKSEDPLLLVQEFKDDATAFNAKKKATFQGKGRLNCRIASLIFRFLYREGVPTHFVSDLDPTRMVVKKLAMVPIEVIVRNRIAGSMAQRLGLPEGGELKPPVVSYHLKNDALGDPVLFPDEAVSLKLATTEELTELHTQALLINTQLTMLFSWAQLILVDFKLEFGRDERNRLVLADEISPDSCRIWDESTQRKLDKDVFRRDLGDLLSSYEEVLTRLEAAMKHRLEVRA